MSEDGFAILLKIKFNSFSWLSEAAMIIYLQVINRMNCIRDCLCSLLCL